MLIFTPGRSFVHDSVRGLDVLSYRAADSIGPAVQPRLAVDLAGGDRVLFYGSEALSVVAQMAEAGVLTATQANAVAGRLRDEFEMGAAAGVAS